MHAPHRATAHEMHRVRYHVYPGDPSWVIQQEGEPWEKAARQSSGGPTLDTRERALARAKELAQRHEFAAVLVHAADGTVEDTCYYGARSPDAVR